MFCSFDQMLYLVLILLREAWIEFQQFLLRCHCGITVALPFEFDHPEVVESAGMLWIKGQRFLQLRDCVIDVA